VLRLAAAGRVGLGDGEDLADLKVLGVLQVVRLHDRLDGDMVPIRDRLDRVPLANDVLHVGPGLPLRQEARKRHERRET